MKVTYKCKECGESWPVNLNYGKDEQCPFCGSDNIKEEIK